MAQSMEWDGLDSEPGNRGRTRENDTGVQQRNVRARRGMEPMVTLSAMVSLTVMDLHWEWHGVIDGLQASVAMDPDQDDENAIALGQRHELDRALTVVRELDRLERCRTYSGLVDLLQAPECPLDGDLALWTASPLLDSLILCTYLSPEDRNILYQTPIDVPYRYGPEYQPHDVPRNWYPNTDPAACIDTRLRYVTDVVTQGNVRPSVLVARALDAKFAGAMDIFLTQFRSTPWTDADVDLVCRIPEDIRFEIALYEYMGRYYLQGIDVIITRRFRGEIERAVANGDPVVFDYLWKDIQRLQLTTRRGQSDETFEAMFNHNQEGMMSRVENWYVVMLLPIAPPRMLWELCYNLLHIGSAKYLASVLRIMARGPEDADDAVTYLCLLDQFYRDIQRFDYTQPFVDHAMDGDDGRRVIPLDELRFESMDSHTERVWPQPRHIEALNVLTAYAVLRQWRNSMNVHSGRLRRIERNMALVEDPQSPSQRTIRTLVPDDETGVYEVTDLSDRDLGDYRALNALVRRSLPVYVAPPLDMQIEVRVPADSDVFEEETDQEEIGNAINLAMHD